MERGAIPIDDLRGGIDLFTTLESGQTYLWRRDDGRMYEGHGPDQWDGDDPPWYYTVVLCPDGAAAGDTVVSSSDGASAGGAVVSPSDDASTGDLVRVRQRDGRLEYAGTGDVEAHVRRLLRLDDDLDAIVEAAPDDPTIAEAYEYARGLRIVQDPPFGCLITFICSAQMRVSRIHGMATRLSETYGDELAVDGRTYHAFPRPEQLAPATEAELRDLSLGYRAPYVQRTAEMVAEGEANPERARDIQYEEAREYLTQFVGVGDKVADCVLLFSLGHLEAVPLDTWIRTAIEEHYPECDRGNYADTSRAIRERFGGEYAGYVQTYVFHYLRTREA